MNVFIDLKDLISDFIFQTSSGRVQLVELAFLYKLYPTTAGLNDGVTNQRLSNTCNIEIIRKNNVRSCSI